MIRHTDFKDTEDGKRALHHLIKKGKIILGGNSLLKIYGQLNCYSGKRMLKKNRIFFNSEKEAILLGYRPCGHCMKEAYKIWKIEKRKSK